MLKIALEQLVYFYSVVKTDRRGLTTVEYAVAGALVAAALVTAFTDLGTEVANTISDLECGVQGLAPGC